MLTITLDMAGDAFANGGTEVSRILRQLAGKIDTYGPQYVDGKKLFDVNGNTVGSVVLS